MKQTSLMVCILIKQRPQQRDISDQSCIAKILKICKVVNINAKLMKSTIYTNHKITLHIICVAKYIYFISSWNWIFHLWPKYIHEIGRDRCLCVYVHYHETYNYFISKYVGAGIRLCAVANPFCVGILKFALGKGQTDSSIPNRRAEFLFMH